MDWGHIILIVIVLLVLAGILEPMMGFYQYTLAIFHWFSRLPDPAGRIHRPRVAVIVPAWNEANVIENTLNHLLELHYPAEAIRIYVIDDASTDETAAIVRHMADEHPQIHHIHRATGGEGKSHTINAGLRQIKDDPWHQMVLIIDADVLFTKDSLLMMIAHMSDPDVGAVSGYIKEGTTDPNYLNKFIGFEYITAQAAGRRAQNVIGAQACVAGGAQLLRREALEEIGGEIDTSTLAEDTVTTFEIQTRGWKVIFEPSAVIWAEEPAGLTGLWKQRLRWARGNVAVTWRFRRSFFKWDKIRSRGFGGLQFSLIWFSIILMPVMIILSSAALVALWIIDRRLSEQTFLGLWFFVGFVYFYVTITSLCLDKEVARRTWLQGFCFPGLVSVALILYGVFGTIFAAFIGGALSTIGLGSDSGAAQYLLLGADIWLTAAMILAPLLRHLENVPVLAWAAKPLLYIIGYGPFLCAVTLRSYWEGLFNKDLVWDKTEKSGNIAELDLG